MLQIVYLLYAAIFGRITLCISLLFHRVNGEFECGKIAVRGFKCREVSRRVMIGGLCVEVSVSE